MKRNLLGAIAVASGLTLWSTVGSLAQDLTPAQAKDAVSNCAKTLTLTPETGFTGEAAAIVAETNAEATLGLAEITAEANQSIDEVATENDEEDSAKSAQTLSTQLNAIVSQACQAIANLQAEYNAAIAEIKAEVAQPEQPKADQPETEKADVEKPESEPSDSERDQPKQRTEAND
jgi:hypothetical protein